MLAQLENNECYCSPRTEEYDPSSSSMGVSTVTPGGGGAVTQVKTVVHTLIIITIVPFGQGSIIPSYIHSDLGLFLSISSYLYLTYSYTL